MFICIICHNMLKKIKIFKQQVEDSVAILLNKVPQIISTQLHKLQRSAIEIDGAISKTNVTNDTNVKPEPTDNTNTAQTTDTYNVATDVKIEPDFSDNEIDMSDMPLSKFKDTVSVTELRYDGKIGIIILSEKDLLEERECLAQNEGYLKLPYKCTDCIVGFDHEQTLTSHMEKRHKMTKKGFQCNICKSVLINKSSYNEHTKRHIRRIECMICHKRYNHMNSAVQHYDEQHATPGETIQQGYTCKECGYTTISNRAYRHHMDKHKDKQTCNICGNTFINKNGLNVHMFTIHQQSTRQYRCETCNKQYRARSGLEAHRRAAHAAADARAFCALCGSYYRTPQGLAHHLATHSRHVNDHDKRFICDECGAKFLTKSKLVVHINWEHFKIKTHQCTKCSKVFKRRSTLNHHIDYVHNKKRPPRNKICDYCGRGFTTQTILQSHIRTHTGERPLHCTHCTATFAHSAALYKHNQLLHNGKK